MFKFQWRALGVLSIFDIGTDAPVVVVLRSQGFLLLINFEFMFCEVRSNRVKRRRFPLSRT